MDRNGTALNTLMFIRMSSNIFYPFSTIYPGRRDKPLPAVSAAKTAVIAGAISG